MEIMSIHTFTDFKKMEDLSAAGKDKKLVYVHMSCKNANTEKDSMENSITLEKDVPNITIKTCPIQQLESNKLMSTVELKDITVIEEAQISLVADQALNAEISSLIEVTDITAVDKCPSISITTAPISSSTGLKNLSDSILPRTTITVVKSDSLTELTDDSRNLSKQKEVQKCSIQKTSISPKLPSTIINNKIVNLKLATIQKPDSNNLIKANDTGASMEIPTHDESNFKEEIHSLSQHDLENALLRCTEKFQIPVDEMEPNTVNEICLQVNLKNDGVLDCHVEGNSPSTKHSSVLINSIPTDITSALSSKSDICVDVEKRDDELIAGEGQISSKKVFIRTDSVTVRRRVSKDRTVSEDCEPRKSLNKINEVLYTVHSSDSPNVKDAKFVITCDPFSQLSMADKNPLQSLNSQKCLQSRQDLTGSERDERISSAAKRQKCRKGNIFPTGKKKNSDGDIFCCTYCGNYGILMESLWWNKENYFCSEDCLKEFKEEKTDTVDKGTNNCENMLTSLKQTEQVPAIPFPWGDSNSLFHWEKYLNHIQNISSLMIAAPDNLWDISHLSNVNPFKIGIKLEAIDPFHQSLFCVVTVTDIIGRRVRIHFDGYSSLYDFWCNDDSHFLYPIEWCKQHKRTLRCPPGILNFSWDAYLEHCKEERSAMLSKFEPPTIINETKFEVGMKLEAEDRKNCLICVATVLDIIGVKILVTFDGWESVYDAWFNVKSPFIHPIGWAQNNDMDLCAPKDYKFPDSFNWVEYLMKTRSIAAPTNAFLPRQPKRFKPGMKVEVIDKRNAMLLRVSTIANVDCYKVKIHFDGWDDIYDYWIDDDSPDIHPPLWGERTSHPLEPPLTQEQCAVDVDSGVGCGTPGCKGFGHAKGLMYDNHHTIHGCPYSLQNLNIDVETYSVDRLESIPVNKRAARSAINLERSISPSAEDDTQGKRVRKRRRFFDEISHSSQVKGAKLEENPRKSPISLPKNPVIVQDKIEELCKTENISSNSHQSIFNPSISYKKEISMPVIADLVIDKFNYKNISKLKPLDIKVILDKIGFCAPWSHKFVEHEVDGIAFVMLQQSDLTNVLKISLGPSKKIMSFIQNMKLTGNT